MGTEVEEPRYARQKGGVAPTAMESVAVALSVAVKRGLPRVG